MNEPENKNPGSGGEINPAPVPVQWVDNPLIFIGEEERDGIKGLVITIADGMTNQDAIMLLQHCIDTLEEEGGE